jgi:tetratricopeptide (TPR) repeat protein
MTQSWRILLFLSAGLCPFLASTPTFADPSQDYDQAGMALFRAGQYEKSIQYFNNAVQADSTNWQAYEDMGNAYMKVDDKPNALSSYQKALQLNPGNSTLQALVDNLNDQTGSPASNDEDTQSQALNPPAAPQDDSGYEAPQDQTTVIVRRHRRGYRVIPPVPNYNDGLAQMDHAPIWNSFSIGYAYSAMTDLINGANTTNQVIANSGYSGSTTMDHNGLGMNFELGFLINPYNGIGIGIGYRRASDLNENINFNDGGDFQTINLQPQVVPLTVDYFLFLPDKGGRFFISAGAGLYFGDVHVDNNYDFTNATTPPNPPSNEFAGDLVSQTLGFQVGVGRDFAVSDRIGISIFAKGYYAKLSNFQGTLTDLNGNTGQFGLAIDSDGTVDVPNTSQIGGANGGRYATVDFTGFDVGMSINFYTF